MPTGRIETRPATLVRPGGRIELAEFVLEYDPPPVRLTLRRWGGSITKSAHDFFDALREIRMELEQEGILVNCYGGSRNVHPTAMQKSVGLGKQAYKLVLGRPREDSVQIFDSGPDVDPCTVREQMEFFQEWNSSWRP